MSFLNPGALWLLGLAAGPVLLHLLSLRRARRLKFGDLSLVREARARSLPATRLRQWLILAARCLALAALALALARPVVRGGGPRAGAEAGLDLVILLDTSWSMGAVERGRPRFERVRAAARELAGLAGPDGRVAVAGASSGLDSPLAFARDADEARAGLGRLTLSPRGSDLAAAAAQACRFLGAGKTARRRVLAVLSDNAAHALRGFGALGARPADCGPEVILAGLQSGEALDNAALLDAAPAAEEGPALAARAALYGAGRRSVPLDLIEGAGRAARRVVELSAGTPVSAGLELPSAREPERSGRLELARDALEADDVWHFALRAEPPPRVLLAPGSPRSLEAGGGGYALRTLLGVERRLPFRLDVADLGRLAQVPLEDYAAVIVDDPLALGVPAAAALARYVREGGGLWVLAGSAAGPLRALESLLPARLGEAEAGAAAPGLRAEAAPSEGFAWGEFELAKVAVGRRLRAELLPGAEAWFRDAAGAPLLVAGTHGRGRVLLWASALDVEWTNLALKPVFAAWTDAGLRWLARYDGKPVWRALKVGEPLKRSWGAGELAPGRVELRGPGGRRTALLVRERRLEYDDTREPGLYVLEWDDGGKRRAEAWAVNLDRSGGESDLTPASVLPWRTLRPDSLRQDFDAVVHGREARGGLLAAMAALLLLELALSAPRSVMTAALTLLLAVPAGSQTGDLFVWSQLRYTGAWDPYPGAHAEVLRWVGEVTSVLSVPQRRELTLRDPALFSSPFLVLAGKQAPPALTDDELGTLRDYLTAGGFLWLEDSSGLPPGAFDRWVRAALARALPDAQLRALPRDHVLFKTFFLVRRAGGRVQAEAVEGVEWGGRLVAVYTRGDLLGAWAKDPLGGWLHECVPGGEAQRMDARKLTLNIVMYALTGNYKADAVHQPFLLEKMRQGAP